MAKEKVLSQDEILYNMVSAVGCGTLTAKEACVKLREHIQTLDEKDKKEFMEKAPVRARTIMQVAELFHQELVVIGVGQ